jgi:hypothetical protein
VPFKSKAQQRFLHAHPEKVGGEGKLKEWDEATDFSHLPNKVAKSNHWMQDESDREKSAGTKGTFSAAAQRAGKSTQEFAEEKKNSSNPKMKKRAVLALNFMKAKH